MVIFKARVWNSDVRPNLTMYIGVVFASLRYAVRPAVTHELIRNFD